jgi:type VI secretion system protein ImpA
MIDLEVLLKPIPGEEPCGTDLDLEGDLDYLNFFASAETLLPKSYFEVTDAEGNKRRFDPKSIDLDGLMNKARPLLERTRDVRLFVFLGKLAVLGRDLAAFTALLEATAVFLDQYWNEVHPRAEDGDWSNRQFSIEALDVLPTVVLPLQYLPLINNRRHGWICYRTWMIAKGEVKKRDDDLVLDVATLEQQVFDKMELDEFKELAAKIAALAAVVGRLKKLWVEKTAGATVLNLDKLQVLVDGMAALFSDVMKRRDPAAAALQSVEPGQDADIAVDAPAGTAAKQLGSLAEVSSALEGIAIYFRQFEPSSPALLLILQAQQMLGKSFVEALRILLPSHADAAIINIGKGNTFDLPVQRMAGLLNGSSTTEAAVAVGNPMSVSNRSQALALLEQVGAFYQRAEPSSPVPYLIDRARELAQRDFLSLLRDMLPKGALKTTN